MKLYFELSFYKRRRISWEVNYLPEKELWCQITTAKEKIIKTNENISFNYINPTETFKRSNHLNHEPKIFTRHPIGTLQ